VAGLASIGRSEALARRVARGRWLLHDANGLDTISGGQLLDDTGATDGAFGTGAQKGTFTATLTWAQATQVKPLNFTSKTTRIFTAKFFDNAGGTATATATLAFSCPGSEMSAACDGVCHDISQNDSRYGSCTNACAQTEACVKGQCRPAAFTDCQFTGEPHTCNEFCASRNKQCARKCTNNTGPNKKIAGQMFETGPSPNTCANPRFTYTFDYCDDVIGAPGGRPFQCCCTQ